MAREKDQGGRAAVRNLVDNLGFSSASALEQFITGARQAEQERLTETQRREQALAEREEAAARRGGAESALLPAASLTRNCVNIDVLRWLQSQLGPDIDAEDLAARYKRLHAAKAVALEVLHARVNALVAEPLRVTVNGVATIDNSANVAALERRIAHPRLLEKTPVLEVTGP